MYNLRPRRALSSRSTNPTTRKVPQRRQKEKQHEVAQLGKKPSCSFEDKKGSLRDTLKEENFQVFE
jgi:hypothetical protein